MNITKDHLRYIQSLYSYQAYNLDVYMLDITNLLREFQTFISLSSDIFRMEGHRSICITLNELLI